MSRSQMPWNLAFVASGGADGDGTRSKSTLMMEAGAPRRGAATRAARTRWPSIRAHQKESAGAWVNAIAPACVCSACALCCVCVWVCSVRSLSLICVAVRLCMMLCVWLCGRVCVGVGTCTLCFPVCAFYSAPITTMAWVFFPDRRMHMAPSP